MRIRHCTVLWGFILLLLGTVLLPLAAAADTPPQEGFVFDEDTEAAALKKLVDPMESYLLSVEALCGAISELCAQWEGGVYFDTDQLYSLRAQLLNLLFQPAQEPALARLNTSEFRALRSAALNHMASGATLLRNTLVVFKLQLERKAWMETTAPLGGKGLVGDLETLSRQREEMVAFLSDNFYVFRTDVMPLSFARRLRDRAIDLPGYGGFTNRGGPLNAKATNAILAINSSLKACQQSKEEYKGPFKEIWGQWQRTEGAVSEARVLLAEAGGGLLRIRTAVTGALDSLGNCVHLRFNKENEEILDEFVDQELPVYQGMYDRHSYQKFKDSAAMIHKFMVTIMSMRCIQD